MPFVVVEGGSPEAVQEACARLASKLSTEGSPYDVCDWIPRHCPFSIPITTTKRASALIRRAGDHEFDAMIARLGTDDPNRLLIVSDYYRVDGSLRVPPERGRNPDLIFYLESKNDAKRSAIVRFLKNRDVRNVRIVKYEGCEEFAYWMLVSDLIALHKTPKG